MLPGTIGLALRCSASGAMEAADIPAPHSITLDTYSHLLGGEDADAAERADEMLRRALK